MKWHGVKKLIEKYGSDLKGKFVVIDAEKIRIRPLCSTSPLFHKE